MIHIKFDPSSLKGEQKIWWDKWQEKADKATKAIIQQCETQGRLPSSDFNNEIWRDLKKWLKDNVFHGKCAYCEANIGESRHTEHGEHYRPKGRVDYLKEEGAKTKKVTVKDRNNQSIEHPGYFWLAYHWKNLLPSCERCNTTLGKLNQFPVAQQHIFLKKITKRDMEKLREKPLKCSVGQDLYYLQPDDLNDLEHPLLLHPYFDNPREHIVFGRKGIVAPYLDENDKESPKGANSIKVYDLQDTDLMRARNRVQFAAYTDYTFALDAARREHLEPKECNKKAWCGIPDVTSGTVAFSTAALDYIESFFGKQPA